MLKHIYILVEVSQSFSSMTADNISWRCDFTRSKAAPQMFLTYVTVWSYHTGFCVCGCVGKRLRPLYILSIRNVFSLSFRTARSAQCRHLHRACVHSATSGCVTSAQMCISIREPLPHTITQTCTSNRGPVTPIVLTCSREAPAPHLQLDKARCLHGFVTYISRPVSQTIAVAVQSASLCHHRACSVLLVFPLVLCLFVNHVPPCTIAMNNACPR